MKKVILLTVFILGSMNTTFAQNEEILSFEKKRVLTPHQLKEKGINIPTLAEIEFDSTIVCGQVIEKFNGHNWVLACPADSAEKGKTLNYEYLEVSELYGNIYRVTFSQIDGKKYLLFFKPKNKVFAFN